MVDSVTEREAIEIEDPLVTQFKEQIAKADGALIPLKRTMPDGRKIVDCS